jgi:NADPH:quinone reductase-like Zn-dependent oxidoreductase
MEQTSVMKAWKVLKPGVEHAVLKDNIALPVITEDFQIIIKMVAVGLNPVDYKLAARENVTFPQNLGLDGCGIVHKRGEKVDATLFKEGETLVYLHGSLFNQYGYFAEYAIHDSRYVTVVPSELYKDQDLVGYACKLAAIPCAGFTAYQAVCNRLRLPLYKEEKSSNVKQVKSIVVTAGAGGCGGFCLQLLKLWRETLIKEVQNQVKIITTCSESNTSWVKSLGATHVIDYNNEDVKQRVMEITDNEGVDAWIENVDAESGAIGLKCLSFSGEFVCIGGPPPEADLKSIGNNAQAVHILMLGAVYRTKLHDKQLEIKLMGDEFLKLISKGQIDTLLSEVITFDKIKDYLLKVRERHVKGKVVARVN